MIPVLTQHRTDGMVDVMLSLDTKAVRLNHDRLGPEAPEGFITIGHLLPVHTPTGYQRYRPDTHLAHYIAAAWISQSPIGTRWRPRAPSGPRW